MGQKVPCRQGLGMDRPRSWDVRWMERQKAREKEREREGREFLSIPFRVLPFRTAIPAAGGQGKQPMHGGVGVGE